MEPHTPLCLICGGIVSNEDLSLQVDSLALVTESELTLD